MEPFINTFLKVMRYPRSFKNDRFRPDAGNDHMYAPSIYLLIFGSIVLICELIVMRHEVRGFYLEVVKEMNAVFYVQKLLFGF